MKDIVKGKERIEKVRRKDKGLGWMAGRVTEKHHPLRKWMKFLKFLM